MTELARVDGPIDRVVRGPLFAPLRIRDYRLVWFGESISLLGDQFHYVALSWLVLGLTGSGLALGTVLLAAALPRGAFLLLGGVLSDRVSPRTLMLGSNLVRAVITTAIAALVLGTRIEIWHLILAGALFGSVDAVFFPAINTIVARLVPDDRLAPANAVLQGTQQLMSTVGPALAGFAIAIIGVGAAFAIDAASFAVASVAVWLVRTARASAPVEPATPEPVEPATPEPSRPSMATAMIEGIRAVMGDPVMRMLVLLSTSFNLAFTGPVVVGLPWLVQVRFGGDAVMLGLLFAAFGGGSLVGVVLAGSASRTRNLGGLLLVIGGGTGYLNVTIIAWTQARTEPHLLGRTMSFLMLGSVVGAPLSLAIAGAVIDIDASALFLAAGGMIVATALAGLGSGLPRRMAWSRVADGPATMRRMTMAASLPFTGDDDADRLLVEEPLALLIGFALDQQVPVQKAFSGPAELKRRLGHLDAARIAGMDAGELDAVFRERPALHRFPGAMATNVQALCAAIARDFGNDARRVWSEAPDGPSLEARLLSLPGIGEMKAKPLIAVLGNRFAVRPPGYETVAPTWPTLGDVDSAEALASYQADKRAHKAALREAARG